MIHTKRNFISNDQSISGKNFRRDFSLLQVMVKCYVIYVFFFIIIIFIITIITYLLTRWSRVVLEKLTVNFAASQEIPRIYGTRKFLTVPTSVRRHLSTAA
jgi:hypothetical protein